eukprot:4722521-Pleurochrysis_carterae.AAC.5
MRPRRASPSLPSRLRFTARPPPPSSLLPLVLLLSFLSLSPRPSLPPLSPLLSLPPSSLPALPLPLSLSPPARSLSLALFILPSSSSLLSNEVRTRPDRPSVRLAGFEERPSSRSLARTAPSPPLESGSPLLPAESVSATRGFSSPPPGLRRAREIGRDDEIRADQNSKAAK